MSYRGITASFGDPAYADDICLLAHGLSILTEVKQYAALAGLSIDIPETKLIYRVRQITFFLGKCFKKNY